MWATLPRQPSMRCVIVADGQRAGEVGGGREDHLGAGQQLALPGQTGKRPQRRAGVLPGQVPADGSSASGELFGRHPRLRRRRTTRCRSPAGRARDRTARCTVGRRRETSHPTVRVGSAGQGSRPSRSEPRRRRGSADPTAWRTRPPDARAGLASAARQPIAIRRPLAATSGLPERRDTRLSALAAASLPILYWLSQ